ncbi:MAG: hypothetical protein ACJ8M1_11635 [Chthoniobacterales bacterium]
MPVSAAATAAALLIMILMEGQEAASVEHISERIANLRPQRPLCKMSAAALSVTRALGPSLHL